MPKDALAARLTILFTRIHQPQLYDRLIHKFLEHGIELKPVEFYSSPAEMENMVKRGNGWSLVQESIDLDPDLKLLPIAHLPLTLTTAFICQKEQMRAVLPLLAYRIEKRCESKVKVMPRKRPKGHVAGDNLRTIITKAS